MAKVVVFEDSLSVMQEIRKLFADSGHDIIGNAYSITEAHALLGKMALGDVEADYALVDGTLGMEAQPTFRFALPAAEQTEPPKKKSIFGRKQSSDRREIVVPPDPEPLTRGNDGRQILAIIEAIKPLLKKEITTINISLDSAVVWNGEVDHDLTKIEIGSGLLPLIDRLEEQKQQDR